MVSFRNRDISTWEILHVHTWNLPMSPIKPELLSSQQNKVYVSVSLWWRGWERREPWLGRRESRERHVSNSLKKHTHENNGSHVTNYMSKMWKEARFRACVCVYVCVGCQYLYISAIRTECGLMFSPNNHYYSSISSHCSPSNFPNS